MKTNNTIKIMGSLEKKKVVLVAARPSMGKTQLLCDLASSLLQATSLIISEEIPNDILKKSFLDMGHQEGEASVIIEDTPGLSFEDVENKCRFLKAERNLEYVMIDSLQLISRRGNYKSRSEEINDILRSFQRLANELDISIAITSQLGKSVEQNSDNRPTKADLSSVGIDANNVDAVFFISSDGIYQAQ